MIASIYIYIYIYIFYKLKLILVWLNAQYSNSKIISKEMNSVLASDLRIEKYTFLVHNV